MVAACPATAGQFQSGSCSRLRDYNDIFSLRAFLTLRNRKLNLLAFGERFETIALDITEMCEHVRTGLLLDEAESFGFIEPLYGSGGSRHNFFLSKPK